MKRIDFILRCLKVLAGLTVFAYGVHLTIAADIGVEPWDCFGQGIAAVTPLNYGFAMTLTSIVVLMLDILLKEPLGIGMIIDALYTGNAAQFFNDHCTFTNTLIPEILHLNGIAAVAAGILMMTAGMFFMSFGQVVYMRAGLTCGPRDTLLVGLGKKVPSVPIGLVENAIFLAVFVIGWILGGSAGPGTVLGTLGTGIVMDQVFRLMKFEPRKVKHQNLAESLKLFHRQTEIQS